MASVKDFIDLSLHILKYFSLFSLLLQININFFHWLSIELQFSADSAMLAIENVERVSAPLKKLPANTTDSLNLCPSPQSSHVTV